MKHMYNKKTLCYHYRHEDSQVIYCDGVQDGSVIHVAFASKSDALAYKKEFCRCNNFKNCAVFQMLCGVIGE